MDHDASVTPVIHHSYTRMQVTVGHANTKQTERYGRRAEGSAT